MNFQEEKYKFESYISRVGLQVGNTIVYFGGGFGGGGMGGLPDKVPDDMNMGGFGGGGMGGLPDKVPDDVADKIEEHKDELPANDQTEELQDGLPSDEGLDEVKQDMDDIPAENPCDELDGLKEQMTDAELQEAFETIDTSGNRAVSADELEKGMHILGIDPTDKDMEEMKAEIGEGELDFDQFKTIVQKKGRDTVEAKTSQLTDAFNTFDEDGSGNLDVEEFTKCMTECGQRMSKDDVQEMIKEINPSEPGKINLSEFLGMFSKFSR